VLTIIELAIVDEQANLLNNVQHAFMQDYSIFLLLHLLIIGHKKKKQQKIKKKKLTGTPAAINMFGFMIVVN
jgi:hypothetical protein